MRYVRARVGVPGPRTPLEELAAAEGVDDVHLLAGGAAATETPTYAVSVAGEAPPVRAVLNADPDVLSWEIAGAGEGITYAYVRFQAPPAVGVLRERLTRGSLVVLLPARFHTDSVTVTVVGTATDLSATFDGFPGEFEVDVLEVGSYREGVHRERSLTDRQREVLEVAYRLGYYDQPSGATHATIAVELGCAASTVGEHLKKAERRLVRDIVGRTERP